MKLTRICSWCHMNMDTGRILSNEEYAETTKPNTPFSHGICDDCGPAFDGDVIEEKVTLPEVKCQYIGYSEVTGLSTYRYGRQFFVMDLLDVTREARLVRTKIL